MNGDASLQTLTSAIHTLPDEYLPIKQQALKYINNNSRIDNNNTLKILHRPWVAPLNWGLMLYPGASQDWLSEYRPKTGRIIPDFYGRFLSAINGCFIYDLSLYGIPGSMHEKNLLNRRVLQCHDLAIANHDWMLEYKVPSGYFYFGSRSYSYSENLGYFWHNDKIKAVRKNGKTLAEWTDFTSFLQDEIAVAEKKMLEQAPRDVRLL
ncbi:MAG TPA: hypothetical protein VHD83_14290 [Puia sp.]|nr:hypothetical protein [Puia sp.]